MPGSKDWLESAVRLGTSSVASSFDTLFGILLGPETLWGLSWTSSFRTAGSHAVTLPIQVLQGPN